MDEDEDSTDTDEYEDRRRVMDIPAPSGRCPHHTWWDFFPKLFSEAELFGASA